MSERYVPVSWNRTKILYDVTLAACVLLYLGAFHTLGGRPRADGVPIDPQILAMKAYGSCAFLMMSAALAIGPLARLDRRFLPLLYNRRHLGVATFAVAALHAWEVVGWYFAYSPTRPLVALLSSEPAPGAAPGLPFVPFGIAALAVLAVLAATSHDFWLRFLRPPVWKALHMALYPAYLSVVAHIAFGHFQNDATTAFGILAGGVAAAVCALHLAAIWRERETPALSHRGWLAVGPPDAIPEGSGVVVRPADGEAIAVFCNEGKLSALTNLCAHQNGPLGEGKILDGCVTCPWHGFQFRLVDGCAPPPFTERLATYNLRLADGVVYVDPQPNPPGTPVAPLDPAGARR